VIAMIVINHNRILEIKLTTDFMFCTFLAVVSTNTMILVWGVPSTFRRELLVSFEMEICTAKTQLGEVVIGKPGCGNEWSWCKGEERP
jgi:hypothetical protein